MKCVVTIDRPHPRTVVLIITKKVEKISLPNCIHPRAGLRATDIYGTMTPALWILHGIRELRATQKNKLCQCFICELRNSRLSLSSSHRGIRDDSGFAKVSAADQRLFSSDTLPVTQRSLPRSGARRAARRRRLGVRFDRDGSRVKSFVLRRGGRSSTSFEDVVV